MRSLKTKKAFTLIELLVVITIIAILATGATTVYTAQIQKARDSTRFTDLNAVQAGVQQYYQDKARYPSASSTDWGSGGILSYMTKIPTDPKQGQKCASGPGTSNASLCAYAYRTSDDSQGVTQGAYELSTAVEANGNITNKAVTDSNGDALRDNNRFEIGIATTAGIDTALTFDVTAEKEASSFTGCTFTDSTSTLKFVKANVLTDTSSGVVVIAGVH